MLGFALLAGARASLRTGPTSPMDANVKPQVVTDVAKEDPEAGPDAHGLSGPDDTQEPNEPTIGHVRLLPSATGLLLLLVVGGIFGALGYWGYSSIRWIVRGRFEVADGWTAAKCTIVRQRCYIECRCCPSCYEENRILSDNCVWLDETKFVRSAQGTIVREDNPYAEGGGTQGPNEDFQCGDVNRNNNCVQGFRIVVDFRVGGSCAAGNETCLAEFYEPTVPNLSFEHSCLDLSTLNFCHDPTFIQGAQTSTRTPLSQDCSTEQELMKPACDPVRLNQEGKEVDCYLDPSGKEEVKFHRVGGITGATISLAGFGFICFVLCCFGCIIAYSRCSEE